MKKVTFALVFFPLVMALLMGGCSDPLGPEIATGESLLVISLVGANVGAGPALTLLPADPQFTRYELVYVGGAFDSQIVPFYNSAFQLPVGAGSYQLYVLGYLDDKVVAKSEAQWVTVSASSITNATFTLKPYMEETDPGILEFSLGWDGLSRMPYRAELLIETYAGADGTLANHPAPIEHSLIPPEYRPGSVEGSILLLDRDNAFVNLSGSLVLLPGEYRLTMSVAMDPGAAPASRLDLARIYSNLSTPAPFYYGGGDLYISNTSPDSGASFITGFTFDETPNATTVIGSEPGVDGTRMIMIMVPSDALLTELTPIVTTAEGSSITSPIPKNTQLDPTAGYGKGEIDFSGPTIWTAQAKNGVVQKYTVVVSKMPATSDDAMITNFFFKNYPAIPGNINQDAGGGDGAITVMLPYGSSTTSLTPIVTIVGKSVSVGSLVGGETNPPNGVNSYTFSTDRIFTVTSESDSVTKDYTVSVTVAGNTAAEITRFAIDGYPERAVTPSTSPTTDFGNIASAPDVRGYYPITLRLPYGVSLKNLTPLIQYDGKTLAPLSGVSQNFSGPVQYTVSPETGSPKTYEVTITNDNPDKNTGIFDFRVTDVPAAKVVIGQKPRQDGKIPIVIQVPNGTDETNMIADITLSSPSSTISPPSGKIDFNSGGNYQEAVYTVTSQGNPGDPDPLKRPATQDYVVVVSGGPQYYYDVDGTNGDLTAATEAGTSVTKDPNSAFTIANNTTNAAKAAGVSRTTLYQSLSEDGRPAFGTVAKVADSLGYKITLVPKTGVKAGARKSG
jgi:hypothetical protein